MSPSQNEERDYLNRQREDDRNRKWTPQDVRGRGRRSKYRQHVSGGEGGRVESWQANRAATLRRR
jgi:hypothetical protein